MKGKNTEWHTNTNGTGMRVSGSENDLYSVKEKNAEWCRISWTRITKMERKKRPEMENDQKKPSSYQYKKEY